MLQPILEMLPWLGLCLRSHLPTGVGPRLRRSRPRRRAPAAGGKGTRP